MGLDDAVQEWAMKTDLRRTKEGGRRGYIYLRDEKFEAWALSIVHIDFYCARLLRGLSTLKL